MSDSDAATDTEAASMTGATAVKLSSGTGSLSAAGANGGVEKPGVSTGEAGHGSEDCGRIACGIFDLAWRHQSQQRGAPLRQWRERSA